MKIKWGMWKSKQGVEKGKESVEKPKVPEELLGESDENQVRNVEIQTRCGKTVTIGDVNSISNRTTPSIKR